MSETSQSILLIGISGVLLFTILGWGVIRLITTSRHNGHTSLYKAHRLKSINSFYRLILILFVVSSWAYLGIPSWRKYFMLLDVLDNHYVNTTGFIILVTAFILIILLQRRLDNQLHLFYSDSSYVASSKTVPQTENYLLGCILLVYIGMFVVVSTVVNLILLLIALVGWYMRYTNRQYKAPTTLE